MIESNDDSLNQLLTDLKDRMPDRWTELVEEMEHQGIDLE